MRVGVFGEPQHSGRVKQTAPGVIEKLTPQREGAHRPARVEFVRPVAQTDDPRLAPRAGPAVAGTISVDQDDARPGITQILRSPGAKNASADYGKIEGG